MFETVLALLCGLLALIIVFGTLIGACFPIGIPPPMTEEEEIKWLISLGISEEEAKEIVKL